ncbi:glycosyltransferase [Candidatus Woesearchaeota archaeon]|nr:glycosyltransferase [Candidatus Woesearchaeota archaeon]
MAVSVIIPAYNEEKYIERTLQALHDVEVIVVCNGCTDKTAELAGKYTDKVLVLEIKGVSHARNTGAGFASHHKLVFLDADILVDEKVLKNIAETKYSIGTCAVKADSPFLFDKSMMWLKSKFHRFGYCTGLLFCDKDLFDAIGRFEEYISAGEDGKLLREGKKRGSFGIVEGYVYNNMRRYRKMGYLSICWYWIKHRIVPSQKEYESVR